MLKCKMYYKHHIYNISYFPYFSVLKTAEQKKPVSILKPVITGSYWCLNRHLCILPEHFAKKDLNLVIVCHKDVTS